jgi:hypothetical protein
MHPDKKEPPIDTENKGDWIDVLRKHIEREIKEHEALAFYCVILKKGGSGESLMAGHPELPVQHVFDHVLQCLNEDIAYEEMK